MKGLVKSVPFLMVRTMPPFSQTKMRPPGANASPTAVNGPSVATVSAVNPASVKVSVQPEPGVASNSNSVAATTISDQRVMKRRSLSISIPVGVFVVTQWRIGSVESYSGRLDGERCGDGTGQRGQQEAAAVHGVLSVAQNIARQVTFTGCGTGTLDSSHNRRK